MRVKNLKMKEKISKIKTALNVIKQIKNWPVYFLDYFKIGKNKNIVYIFRNGIKLKTRAGTNDRVIINEIWIRKFYNPEGFEIKKGETVVDIGAHIGVFSIFASRNAQKVYAFEPVLENFELLKSNIEINNLENIIVPINKAVSGKTEEREIFFDNDNFGGHSFYSSLKRSGEKKVSAVSLEDFIKENKIEKIDFLKIDCEGAEYDILFNCPVEILQRIEKISMEYHNIDKNRNAVLLKNFLEEKRFRVILSFGNEEKIYAIRQFNWVCPAPFFKKLL